MKKLAVFFPGIGYTNDKPLMYYTRKLALEEGYEILPADYTGFPEKVRADRERMKESIRIADLKSREILQKVDLSAFESLLFVSKSIGTVVSARLASEAKASGRIRQVLYTPLEEAFSFPIKDAIVFTGSADPWTGKEQSRIPMLCRERKIPCTVISGANHSLECGDAMEDIRNLYSVMQATANYITYTAGDQKPRIPGQKMQISSGRESRRTDDLPGFSDDW